MRTYITATLTIAAFILISFIIVEALGIPLLTDPSGYFEDAGLVGATVSAGLLIADVFIPVPSSLVMIANGAMFGIIGGSLLTLVSSVGGALVGFLVGRRGSRFIHRFVSPADQLRADAFIRRWGLLAIIVSRPMPILAETVAIMAGTTSLSWKRMLFGSIAGILPLAIIYAVAGAYTTNLGSGFLVFGVVIIVAGLTWVIGRRLESHVSHTTSVE